MQIDKILEAFARREVDALLIGGMNFLLRHQGGMTFDIDFWVRDSEENLVRVIAALGEIGAEWGRDESSWKPIAQDTSWLRHQSVVCLTTRYGAVDIFREVKGLEGQYEACRSRAKVHHTATGIPYRSLADEDMLTCQLSLNESERRLDRIAYLQKLLKKS
jgi:hypothetical protein